MAVGIPITIGKMIMPTKASGHTRGRCGSADNGSTTKFITVQINNPNAKADRYLFFDRMATRGYTKK